MTLIFRRAEARLVRTLHIWKLDFMTNTSLELTTKDDYLVLCILKVITEGRTEGPHETFILGSCPS